MTVHHEIVTEATKASPPLTVVGLSLAGVSLQDWMLLLTIVYTVLQLGLLIRDRIYRPYKEAANGSD